MENDFKPGGSEPINSCTWSAPMVTLIDGSQVFGDSEPWRFECEARHILDMPDKPTRVATLENIEKRRGAQARIALEDKILEVWQARRSLALAESAGA